MVSKEIDELVRIGPWESQDWKSRGFALRADLDRFVDGSLINAVLPRKEKPYEVKDAAYIRLLHPWADEVWEIRSVTTAPSIRVFGRFADQDLFVALTWSTRAELARPPWRNAQVSCRTEWTKLFHPYPSLTGANLHDYIATDVVLV
jgi:hypothetical protein